MCVCVFCWCVWYLLGQFGIVVDFDYGYCYV